MLHNSLPGDCDMNSECHQSLLCEHKHNGSYDFCRQPRGKEGQECVVNQKIFTCGIKRNVRYSLIFLPSPISFSCLPNCNLPGTELMFAKCDMHNPSRFGQTSLATAVANFTKPRTSHFFDLCRIISFISNALHTTGPEINLCNRFGGVCY